MPVPPPKKSLIPPAPTNPAEAQKKLEEKMVAIKLNELERLTQNKATSMGLPYITLGNFPISEEALTLIPEEDAEKDKVVCFFRNPTQFRIGSPNPLGAKAQEWLRRISEDHGLKGEIYLISSLSFNKAIDLYKKLPKIKETTGGVEITATDLRKFQASLESLEQLNSLLQKISLTDLVTLLISSAIQTKSSDIHIEAESDDVKVRFRIDGILHTVASLPKANWTKIISRIKLLSHLKLNVTDQPQDGRFTIFLEEETIDVRVSTIPDAYGESVVMRLLMSSAVGLQFEDLGLRGRAFDDLKKEIERPNGMIITTGPTGSGKTTTLYAILNKLNDEETKIITLEDPIEYKLKGVVQSQITNVTGSGAVELGEGGEATSAKNVYTFASGLRSILRQDPDVVMVGEIRDLETAETAINAALTGHLVLSTIHTNSAAGAIPRFLAMGVKPFLLAPALNAIIGQRLVRRICDKCKEQITLDPGTLQRVTEQLKQISPASGQVIPDLNNLKFYNGRGCSVCHKLGYKGRIGIYEIMAMNQEVEKVILSGQVSEYVIQDLAQKNGMITMVQDGLLKAIEGITTVEEVMRHAK